MFAAARRNLAVLPRSLLDLAGCILNWPARPPVHTFRHRPAAAWRPSGRIEVPAAAAPHCRCRVPLLVPALLPPAATKCICCPYILALCRCIYCCTFPVEMMVKVKGLSGAGVARRPCQHARGVRSPWSPPAACRWLPAAPLCVKPRQAASPWPSRRKRTDTPSTLAAVCLPACTGRWVGLLPSLPAQQHSAAQHRAGPARSVAPQPPRVLLSL